MNQKIKIARLLRQEQTKAEKKLWGHLRNRQLENLKFRRQHPLKEFIVDFFCEEFGIVIELDGEYHNFPNQKEKDHIRDNHLKNLGYSVLRFENKLVFQEIDIVLKAISTAKNKQQNYAEQRRVSLTERKKKRLNHLTPALSSRRGSKSILSTKILSPSQQELVLNAGLGLTHYNTINIVFNDFKLPSAKSDHLIFTSQNGIKSYVKNQGQLKGQSAFCVGAKTKAFLTENDVKVVEMAHNSSELGEIIVKSHKNSSFLHIGGNLKLEGLATKLREYNIRYVEIEAYRTELNPKKFERPFDGVLFYSPSGVKSFTHENKIAGTAFCIGTTTAAEAQKYTDKIIIAKKPTIENVIVQAVKYFDSHLQANDKTKIKYD